MLSACTVFTLDETQHGTARHGTVPVPCGRVYTARTKVEQKHARINKWVW